MGTLDFFVLLLNGSVRLLSLEELHLTLKLVLQCDCHLSPFLGLAFFPFNCNCGSQLVVVRTLGLVGSSVCLIA